MRHHANVTYGELLQNPEYNNQLRNALGRRPVNNINDGNAKESPCQIIVRLKGTPIKAIMDTGAVVSIVSTAVTKALELKYGRPDNIRLVAFNKTSSGVIGTIHNAPLAIGGVRIPTKLHVVPTTDNLLILGKDWINQYKANIMNRENIVDFLVDGRNYQTSMINTISQDRGDDVEPEPEILPPNHKPEEYYINMIMIEPLDNPLMTDGYNDNITEVNQD